MAQAQLEREETTMEAEMMMKKKDDMIKESGGSGSFKFNAQAPEFVPMVRTQVPVSGYFYPFYPVSGGSDWVYSGDLQEPVNFVSNSNVGISNCSKDGLTVDLQQKIIKQAEYHFSDISLLANESLAKQINKDPEGYVPISVVTSTKKIKSLTSNNLLVAQALRSSSMLIVSNDGKKVKRKHPFTEKEKEDLQSRTVVAENLPEDHSHQNLEKMFNVVGSVKSIRICHPQEPNSSRSRGDFVISNKLHALVEYETTEIAEKAVDKLNDERNWRKGLRVRLLLRCSPKSVLKCRKSDFDGYLEDDEGSPIHSSLEEFFRANYNSELIMETHAEEGPGGSKKLWIRGRVKPRPRTPIHNGRGLLEAPSKIAQFEATMTKQSSRGPRMPDGTKGFTMGRGRPIGAPPQTACP